MEQNNTLSTNVDGKIFLSNEEFSDLSYSVNEDIVKTINQKPKIILPVREDWDLDMSSGKAPIKIFGDEKNMFINAHGFSSKEFGGFVFDFDNEHIFTSPKQMYQILKADNLIPDSIKNIYTINCFGGYQKSFDVDGIHVSSIHGDKKDIQMATHRVTEVKPDMGIITKSIIADELTEEGKKLFEELNSQDAIPLYEEIISKEQIDEAVKKYSKDHKLIKKPVKKTEEASPTESTKKIEQENKKSVEVNDNTPKTTKSASKKSASKDITNSLAKKSLGGKGKLAIGIAIAGAVAVGTGAAIKKNNEKKEQQAFRMAESRREDTYAIDNSYAMQMAQDISSYRYGKHMTGFVNR